MRALSVALLALVCGVPAAASAQGSGVLVERFEGPGADELRDAVLEPIARARGLLALPPSRAEGIAGDEATVLHALGARARVSGSVTRVSRARLRVEVSARSATGDVVGEARFMVRRARQARTRVSAWTRRDLVPALRRVGQTRAASAVAPPTASQSIAALPPPLSDEDLGSPVGEHAADPTTAADHTAESSVERFSFEGGAPPPPFVFDVGISATHRRLDYSDDLFESLTPHALPIAPYLRLALEWFPGGHEDLGLLDGLSARLAVDAAMGAHSVLDNGVAYPTDGWGFALEARYRIRFENLLVRIDAGYDAQGFGLRDADARTPRPAIPSVETHSLRAGGALRVDLAHGVFVTAEGGYLHPLSFGELAQWFRGIEGGGADAALGLGLAIDDVEVRASFRYRRFFYTFHPEPGDTHVAGGASDEYLSGALSLVYAPPGLRTR